MGTSLSYGSYSFKPVPDISFNSEIQRSEAGYIVGVTDKITLKGVLYGSGELNKDNNTSSANNIQVDLGAKLTGLKDAFQKDYQDLKLKCGDVEIYSSPANLTIVDSINFDNSTDNNWLQIIDYTINLSVFRTGLIGFIPDSGFLVSTFTNTYNITTNDDKIYYNKQNAYPRFNDQGQTFPSYSISREISAQGIHGLDKSALQNAINFVSGLVNSNTLKLDNMTQDLFIFDRSTEINKDPINGTYSIRDTFAAYSGSSGWTDSFSVTATTDANLRRTVEIAGEVQGLANYPLNLSYNNLLDNSFVSGNSDIYATSKWITASGGFFNNIKPLLYGRAVASYIGNTGLYSGIIASGKFPFYSGLNPIPLNINVEHNIQQGSISYNYTYDSRPLSLIAGALNETIDMEDSFAIRSYVFTDVFYRLPLAQDLGTYGIPKRSVSYTASFPKPFSGIPPDLKNAVNGALFGFAPSGISPTAADSTRGPKFFSWLTENSESLDVFGGKYTRKLTWEYQKGYLPP